MNSFKFFAAVVLGIISTSGLYAQMRIMPLGDSITYDDRHSDVDNFRPLGIRGGYRKKLYYLLQDQNVSFNFVGSQIVGADIQPPIDPHNEGHPGWTNGDLAKKTYGFLVANPADTILLHSGTNHHQDVDKEISDMNHMLDEIDQYEHDAKMPIRVVLALIIPRQDDVLIPRYNNQLLELAHQRTQKGDDIIVVDMYHDAGLTSSDWSDGTHPNDGGFDKMAPVWVPGITAQRNDYLYYFPISLVPRDDIVYANVDENANGVTFITTIPDAGIHF